MQYLVKDLAVDFGSAFDIVLSDSSKLEVLPTLGRVQLKELSKSAYGKSIYTTDPVEFSMPNCNIPVVNKWFIFQGMPMSTQLDGSFTVKYRINNGQDDYWFNTTNNQWEVVVNSTDWNVDTEISSNVRTYTYKDFNLKVQLQSLDKYTQAFFGGACIMYNAQIDYMKSFIRSAILENFYRSYRYNICRTFCSEGTSKYCLTPDFLGYDYDVMEVFAVYDNENDPGNFTNLLSSFDPVTKDLVLTQTTTYGDQLVLLANAMPSINFNFTSQDYIENDKVPSVIIESFEAKGNEVTTNYQVIDVSSQSGYRRERPFKFSFEFSCRLLAESSSTLLGMKTGFLNFLSDNGTLIWHDIGEGLSLDSEDEIKFNTTPNLKDVHETTVSFTVSDVYFWIRPEQLQYVVQNAQINLELENISISQFSTTSGQGGVDVINNNNYRSLNNGKDKIWTCK